LAVAEIVNEPLTAGMTPQRQIAPPAPRHPFRHRMRHVTLVQRRAADDNDLKLFGLSFLAFFVCFYTFIF
jgi:hypothetical protein